MRDMHLQKAVVKDQRGMEKDQKGDQEGNRESQTIGKVMIAVPLPAEREKKEKPRLKKAL